MEYIKMAIVVLALIGLWTGGYVVGRGHGEMKVEGMLYLVEHIEKRIGAIDVIEKGKTSGFAKAIINEE